MKVLVIDIGGTHVKVASTDMRVPIKIPSGPTMDAEQMTQQVLATTAGWTYDCISIGYPGPVVHDHPLAEPHNLGAGWIDFPYSKAFGKPIRFINDAAMQALGGYKGGRMLFLGTGTGLGSAMIFDGTVIPLELAHLPYKKGRTYEEYIGLSGLELRGKKRWRKSVIDIITRLQAALICDYVVLGGGNAKLMNNLPNHVIIGANSNAIDGGLKLWQDDKSAPLAPPAQSGTTTKATSKAIAKPKRSA
jgi:polyphosphate glucokinase